MPLKASEKEEEKKVGATASPAAAVTAALPELGGFFTL